MKLVVEDIKELEKIVSDINDQLKQNLKSS